MQTASQPNPTVARWELATALRRAREQHKRGLDELAARLGVTQAQASRLDSGKRGYPVDQVRDLTAWYGLDSAQQERLMVLATESRRRAWWQQVDLAPAYRSLIGMEQAASSISEFAGSFIPGLLQTPDYARVVASSGDADFSSQQIAQAVDVRVRRQKVLDRSTSPTLTVVMDEVALARGPRKRSVRRAQLEHLHAVAERPRITVQVIGFEFGLHAGGSKHFILLGMGSSVPDFAYSEGPLDPAEHSTEQEIARYRRLWEELRGVALDPETSRRLIKRYLDDAS